MKSRLLSLSRSRCTKYGESLKNSVFLTKRCTDLSTKRSLGDNNPRSIATALRAMAAMLAVSLCMAAAPQLSAGPVAVPGDEFPGAVRPGTHRSERPGAIRPGTAAQGDPVISPELAEGMVENLDIPPLIDRPFSPEDAPFVQVDEFRLINVEDLPEYDITRVDVEEIVGSALSSQPGRGYSIGEMQLVADEVTNYYRSKGLILSQAVIPVQTVYGGTVDIQVSLGILGRVLVENNNDYDADVLRAPFTDLIGRPITRDGIEGALLTLTDFPGLSIYGVFNPGVKPGEADIILNVQEEKWYEGNVHADNHGVPEIGRGRVRGVLSWNNPVGGADKLTVSIQHTINPENNLYVAGDYSHYFNIFGGMRTGVSYFQNAFEVDSQLVDLDLSSRSRHGSLYFEKSFLRSRRQNLSARMLFSKKHSETILVRQRINRTHLSVLTLEGSYDLVDSFHPLHFLYSALFDIDENFGGGLNFVDMNYSHGFNELFGSMGGGNRERGAIGPSRRYGAPETGVATGQFSKFFVSASRLQLLSENQSLLMRGEIQTTSSVLTSTEQYSIGGPNNVRAFPEAQALVDRVFFMSVDYIINAPFFANAASFSNRTWGELLQLSLFYDMASGKINEPLYTYRGRATDDVLEKGSWITYRGAGASLRFNLPGTIDARMIWATQLGDNSRTPSDNGHKSQFWGDFTFSF
ncbi:MAG: ShlB/FhaC/HecB family hemolysin secretion/activation protein [Candidatus Eutrophobiaceae bacterium]